MRGRRIGIDLGGTKIEGAVIDEDGRPVVRERVPTERERGYAHVLDRVAALVDRLRPQAPEAAVVGVGAPGSPSARDGTLKNSNTTCLNGRPLRADLEARLGCTVRLENDANCFALAEARGGAGRGHRVCVEAFLSGPALAAAYRAAGGAAVEAPEVLGRAAAGEARAAAVVDRWLDRFGRALANVIDVLDPDVVVLGGGLSNVDALYDRGRAAVARYVFNDELRTPIVRHRLGDSAGVIGAALLGA